MKIRFRRFRLISIDTHLWSELTSRRIIGGGERTAKDSRRLASRDSAAGAGGLSVCLGDFCDVPERRCPRYPVPVRLNDVSLTDLDLSIQVRAVKPRSLGPVVIRHCVRLTRGIHSVLVGAAIAAPRLDGTLVTHGNNFRVLVSLRQRGRTGVKPEDGNDDQYEKEHEALPQF